MKQYAFLLPFLLVFIACGKRDLVEHQSSHLAFSAFYENSKITCDATFEHAQKGWRLNTMAFFVSDLQVQTPDLGWQNIAFSESDWQSKQSALIWFATNCDTDTQQNSQAKLVISPEFLAQVQKIRFTLGIPFAVNHLNPLTQAPPLNNPEMFWSWRNGHKFLRIDTSSIEPNTSNETWSFHLGSIDCVSDSSLREPKTECKIPNRVSVELEWQANDMIVLDLAVLLNKVALKRDQSCMFNVEQLENCQFLLNNLQNKEVFKAIPELKPTVSEI